MLPGAGTKCRFRSRRLISSRTSATGWDSKIQPPVATCMPSSTPSSASASVISLSRDAMRAPQFSRWREITMRWIWFVPSQIWLILASRIMRSTG